MRIFTIGHSTRSAAEFIAILQEVVEKYAQSPEAAQAKQKLRSLES